MKKYLITLLTIILLFSFSACGSKEEITFNTLDLNATNIVANSVEEFDFKSETKIKGGIKCVIAKDKEGKEEYQTTTVPLEEGDNVFYLFAKKGNEVKKTYSVTIRRRPMYRVSFNTAGGTSIDPQTVEEGFTATAPTETVKKLGYTFNGWDYDFNNPITKNVMVNAILKVNEEMSNFKFTSSATACKITGLKSSSLSEVVIPEYVTSVTEDAFEEIYALTIYCEAKTQPEGFKENWNNSLPIVWDCKNNDIADDGSLYAVIDGIRYILEGDKAIVTVQETDEKNVTIPSSVTYKGKTYPVTEIGAKAFYYVSLDVLTLPNSITTIRQGAIKILKKHVVIPSSVVTMEEKAFNDIIQYSVIYCEVESEPSGWHEDWINTGYATIIWGYNYVFENGVIYGIKDNQASVVQQYITEPNVVIASTVNYNGKDYPVTTLEKFAFFESGLIVSVKLPDTVKLIKECAFLMCGRLTDVDLGKGVEEIQTKAFMTCTSLTTITFPSSLKVLGKEMFRYSTKLESINVDANNKNFKSVDGVLYNFDGTSLIVYPSSKADETFTVPSGVINLESCSFSSTQYLKNVIIGDTVQVIKEEAFWVCDSIENVTIGSSVVTIEKKGFFNFQNLKSIIIPKTVQTIGADCFYYCSDIIVYVEVESKPSSWHENWYNGAKEVIWDYKNQPIN